MTRVYETVRDAAELWVSQFNAVPQGMLDKLMRDNPDEWREVTEPTIGGSMSMNWRMSGTRSNTTESFLT